MYGFQHKGGRQSDAKGVKAVEIQQMPLTHDTCLSIDYTDGTTETVWFNEAEWKALSLTGKAS